MNFLFSVRPGVTEFGPVDVNLLLLVMVLAFVALLFAGRAQLAKGANASVANGATLLTLAAVLGIVALSALLLPEVL